MKVIAKPDDGSKWCERKMCPGCGWLVEIDRTDVRHTREPIQEKGATVLVDGFVADCCNCRATIRLRPTEAVRAYARAQAAKARTGT